MSTIRRLAPIPAFVAFVASPLACSEAVPPAAEGAYAVELIQVSGGQGPCLTGRTDGLIGSVDSTSFFDLKKDGVGATQMQCGVFPNGDGTFYAEGELRFIDATANEFLTFRIPFMSPVATEAAPSVGAVSFRNVDTVNLFSSAGDACRFWLQGNEEVAAGRIWVEFECPSVISGMQSCQIQRGTIAMQNCDQ